MAGLNLGVGFRVNADAALRKRPKKLTEGGGGTVVPAARPGPTTNKKFSPGGYVPRDPVPAILAKECIVEAFKPGVSFCADPVPARSA